MNNRQLTTRTTFPSLVYSQKGTEFKFHVSKPIAHAPFRQPLSNFSASPTDPDYYQIQTNCSEFFSSCVRVAKNKTLIETRKTSDPEIVATLRCMLW